MKKLLLLTMVLGLLIGCANKVWMLPEGATQMDFQRDKAQCLYEARIYTHPSRAYVPPPPAHHDRYGLAIALGGLATAIARGAEEGTNMALLFNACMNARGYFLVDKPQPQPPLPQAPTNRGYEGSSYRKEEVERQRKLYSPEGEPQATAAPQTQQNQGCYTNTKEGDKYINPGETICKGGILLECMTDHGWKFRGDCRPK